MAKKYYWLKLKNDFFTQPKMKKLRRIAGGDTYTIIYLKLQLLSLQDEGKLFFEGIEDSFIEELALNIDEDLDNVKFTVMYLINQNLLEEVEKDEFLLTETKGLIAGESESAQRVRRMRLKRKQQELLQCNTKVTNCNTDIDIELEKEIDKDIEIYSSHKRKEVEVENDDNTELLFKFHEICCGEGSRIPKPKSLTPKRIKKLNARKKEYTKEDIINVFNIVSKSEFLKGNVVTFRATFDWILEPANFIKILEGNYTTSSKKSVKENRTYENIKEDDDLPF